MHSLSDLSHTESRFIALENQLKGLAIQQPQIFQSASMMRSHRQFLYHTWFACSYYAPQLSIGTEQVNMTYQRPRNDPFAPTYNPEWRNHPNFSWTQGQNLGGPSIQTGMFSENTPIQPYHGIPRPPPPISYTQPPLGYTEIDKRFNNLEKS